MAVTEHTNLYRSIRSYTNTDGCKVTIQKYSSSRNQIDIIDQESAAAIEKYQLENNLKTARFVNYKTEHSTGILNLYVEIKRYSGLYRGAFKVHVVNNGHHHFHLFAFRGEKIQEQANRAVQIAWLLTKDNRGYDTVDLHEALAYVKTDEFWERIYGSLRKSLENLGLPRKPMHHLAMTNSLQDKGQLKYIHFKVLRNEMVSLKVNMPKTIRDNKECVLNFTNLSRSCSNYDDLLRILALYAAYICHLTTRSRLEEGGCSYVLGLYFQLASVWRETIEDVTTTWRWDLSSSEFELNLTHFIKRVDAELVALGDKKLFNSTTKNIVPLHNNIEASVTRNTLDDEVTRDKYYKAISEQLPKQFSLKMLEKYLPELFHSRDFSIRAIKSLPRIVKVGRSLKYTTIIYTVMDTSKERRGVSCHADEHESGRIKLFEIIKSFAGERQFKLNDLHSHIQNHIEIDPFDIKKLSPRTLRKLMSEMPSIIDIKPEKSRDKMRFQIDLRVSAEASERIDP